LNLESKVGKGSTFKVVFPHVEFSEFSTNALTSSYLSDIKRPKDEEPDTTDLNEKHESYVLDGQLDFKAINNTDYNQLIRRFDHELTERWKMFEKKQPLREIQSFAQELVALGKSFKLGFITQYGEQLLSTIENFDIEEMRLKLDYFPDLLKQLKKIGHEN
jgi:hypothetical protein